MARILVRTHPIEVYYLTDKEAEVARLATGDPEPGVGPCFTTSSEGADGFAWDTCEEFERDYRESFPDGGLGSPVN